MRLVAAIVILGGLAAAAFWLPFGGRTGWQRAQQQGLPGAAARAVGSAARSVGAAAGAAWRWANDPGTKAARSEPGKVHSAARPEPVHARTAPPRSSEEAAPKTSAAHAPARQVALAKELRQSPAASPPPADAASRRDHIVHAPPPEALDPSDRAALDRLVSRAHP
jgi:hypothetical protein